MSTPSHDHDCAHRCKVPVNLSAPVYRVEELAVLLHRTENTIRLDASRAPHRLPPICRLPGHNRLLWRRCDVEAWLAAAVTTATATLAPALLPRRRGRPTNAEQRQRIQRDSGVRNGG